ncbi:PHB depolymerase family esterase [Frankia sp. AgB32]|uniref:alpha/beta hydrolase family esterase n=1 Tax=Frankia sp. AgB32 TaxID=631119 RepID=UPI00200C159F|nr:PHB depolymerase family esterase [Frankia sp. AgB32]MCK9897813.1 plasmid partitioning protein [Frankia sp. AgB32]
MTTNSGPPRRRRRPPALFALVAAVALTTGLAACGPADRAAGGSGSMPSTQATSTAAVAAGPGAVPVGRSSQTLVSDGVSRMIHLYRPAGLTEPAPLVVMLHGGYGSGTQAEQTYHWDAAADAGHFLVALPDGSDRSWNAGGGCCGPAARSGVDDVAFLTRAVASLGHQIRLDPHRIFLSGVSNGGAMAYRMACETDLFAAVGVDSTTMLVDCAGATPASVLHIHGTDDPTIRYDGGPGKPYSPNSTPIDGPPVPAVNETWRGIDRCAAPAITTRASVTTSTAACPAGRTVQLVTIAGAGHQWPGATPSRAAQLLGADTPSTALDATSTIWRFFAAHPSR